MGTAKKLGAIALLIGAFAAFDLSVYGLFTKRCIDTSSEEMKKYSVEIHRYMPFDENSEAVKVDTDTEFREDLPVLDGAAALYRGEEDAVRRVPGHAGEAVDAEDEAGCGQQRERNPEPGEAEAAAEEEGAELEMVPIGREAFVFIVNSGNPVDGLTSEQVRDIFAGDIKMWSEVGGEHLPIEALSRNKGSGSQTTMDRFMGGREQKYNYLGGFGRSIGYSFRYYVDNMVGNGGAKKLALDGVYPDKEHIADGTYPLASTFYAVYRKDNENEQIPALIDWILSDEGQSVVEKAGYVPVS